MGAVEFLKENEKVIKQAPWAFLTCAILSGGAVFTIAQWHYSNRIDELDGLNHRYARALGIDERSLGAVVQLTNDELKSKAAHIISGLRELYQDYDRKALVIENDQIHKKLTEDESWIQNKKLRQQIGEEYGERFKAEYIITLSECERRLDPKVLSQVVRVPLKETWTDKPLPIQSLTPNDFAAGMLELMADELDQVALHLESESAARWRTAKNMGLTLSRYLLVPVVIVLFAVLCRRILISIWAGH